MTQLPAHLQNMNRDLVGAAMSGMAGLLPPRVSIKANHFTFVDATGIKRVWDKTYFDAVLVDISEVMCKRFYAAGYIEGSDNPPDCWSTNGVGPSIHAAKPQARTCAECKNNERGSAISNFSGKEIRACRDEKQTAFILKGVPDMLWQLVVTPGSFKNFSGYIERLRAHNYQPYQVWTRIAFDPEKTGVLTFTEADFIDAPMAAVISKAWDAKATDLFVGRNDVPIGTGSGAMGLTNSSVAASEPPHTVAPPAQSPFKAIAPLPSSVHPSASTARNGPDTQKRHRRTKAEMEAAKAAEEAARAAPSQNPPSQPAAQPAPQPAPFMQGEPEADLTATLDSFFGQSK